MDGPDAPGLSSIAYPDNPHFLPYDWRASGWTDVRVSRCIDAGQAGGEASAGERATRRSRCPSRITAGDAQAFLFEHWPDAQCAGCHADWESRSCSVLHAEHGARSDVEFSSLERPANMSRRTRSGSDPDGEYFVCGRRVYRNHEGYGHAERDGDCRGAAC